MFFAQKNRPLLAQEPYRRNRLPRRWRGSIFNARPAVEELEQRTQPAIYTVTNLADSGPGSLRDAIQSANSSPGTDLINFSIAGLITPNTPLPNITDPVTIDGWSAPGFSNTPLIELRGSNLSAGSGLVLGTGQSTIRGLSINSFPESGILVTGALSTGNRIQGNRIGTDLSGTIARPNAHEGITIDGVSQTLIGTDADGSNDTLERNIISGNGRFGLWIRNGAASTVIAGNYIGTNAAGTGALPNQDHGVVLSDGANQTIIGTDGTGTSAANTARRNLISGNVGVGVWILGGATILNRVAGNYVGTNVTGTSALPNRDGIWLTTAINSSIGSNADGIGDASEGNLVSGNTHYGIVLEQSSANNRVAGNRVGATADGNSPLGNGWDGLHITTGSNNNIVGTDGTGSVSTIAAQMNVISGNGGNGVVLTATNTVLNRVAGNRIGTNQSGTLAIANGNLGIIVNNQASFNFIGTDGDGVGDSSEGNLISGNTSAGVLIADSGTNFNRVAGNYIGTDVTGNAALANRFNGVWLLNGPANNVIGTNADGISDTTERNVIAGNLGDGIGIAGTGTNKNVVAGNYVGLRTDGTGVIANSGQGIHIVDGATNTRVGTNGDGVNDAAERNIIAGSLNWGVVINKASSSIVAGNFIGTNPTGTTALPNRSGGVVLLNGATGNRIGSDGDGSAGDASEGNLISGNLGFGFYFTDATTTNNSMAGNIVGMAAGGLTPLSNTRGVVISNSPNNTIGGASLAERNLISGNTSDGIDVVGTSSVGNTIRNNRIGTNLSGLGAQPNNGRGIFVGDGTTIGQASGAASNTTIRDNLISFNDAVNILVSGSGADNTVITGNVIGLNSAETSINGSGINGGIIVSGGAKNTRIGTNGDGLNDAAEGNVISGLRGAPITVTGSGTLNTVIAGNKIGTDSTGTQSRKNTTTDNGFAITVSAGANNTRIGSDGSNDAFNAAERNVISGNGSSGISINGVSGTVIAGNMIGTSTSGNAAIGNNGFGISLFNATNTRIGTDGNGVFDTIEGNVIGANNADGIRVLASSGTVIAGNTIGTNAAGNTLFRNNGLGIYIFGGSSNTRVGTDGNGIGDADERNVVSGNLYEGIAVESSSKTTIAGNIIGSNLARTAAIPNGLAGIDVRFGSTFTQIGTDGNGVSDLLEGNLIAGNSTHGILVRTPNWNGAVGSTLTSSTTIAGNTIGSSASPNLNNGITVIDRANSTQIGLPGFGNIIVGNKQYGISIGDTTSTVVQGNIIGLVNQPNQSGGIQVTDGMQGSLIGSDFDGVNDEIEGNYISGNNGPGIVLGSSTSRSTFTTPTLIQSNQIGVDSSGKALRNAGAGIWIQNYSGSRVIENVIANNLGNGIILTHNGNGTDNNVISQNSIYANTGLGIDLVASGTTPDSITWNDYQDDDFNLPNRGQNAPILSFGRSDETDSRIFGYLNSKPSQRYRIEFFATDNSDPYTTQSKYYLGSTDVTTDVSGDATIIFSFPNRYLPNEAYRYITSTATQLGSNSGGVFTDDTSEGTSELGAPIELIPVTTYDPFKSIDDDRSVNVSTNISGSLVEDETQSLSIVTDPILNVGVTSPLVVTVVISYTLDGSTTGTNVFSTFADTSTGLPIINGVFQFLPPFNWSGNLTYSIDLYFSINTGSSSTYYHRSVITSDTPSADIAPVPDEPVVIGGGQVFTVYAGDTTTLNLRLDPSVDTDGSETHWLILHNYQPDFVFSVGYEESPGIWVVSFSDVPNLSVTVPAGYSPGDYFISLRTRTDDFGVVNEWDPVYSAYVVIRVVPSDVTLLGPDSAQTTESIPIYFSHGSSTGYDLLDRPDLSGGPPLSYIVEFKTTNGTVLIDEESVDAFGLSFVAIDPTYVIITGQLDNIRQYFAYTTDLGFQPTAYYSGTGYFDITVTSSDGRSAEKSITIDIISVPNIPAYTYPPLEVRAFRGSSTNLGYTLGDSSDTDGSETHWLVIRDYPSNITFSVGTEESPGVWVVPQELVADLSVIIPDNFEYNRFSYLPYIRTNDSGVVIEYLLVENVFSVNVEATNIEIVGPDQIETLEDTAYIFSTTPLAITNPVFFGQDFSVIIQVDAGTILDNKLAASFNLSTIIHPDNQSIEYIGLLHNLHAFLNNGTGYGFIPPDQYGGSLTFTIIVNSITLDSHGYIDVTTVCSKEIQVTVDPDPDAPVLTWLNTEYRIPVNSSQELGLGLFPSVDIDGSESHFIVIRNYPNGITFSAGYEENPGTWVVAMDSVAGLSVVIPPGFTPGQYILQITTRTDDAGIIGEFNPALLNLADGVIYVPLQITLDVSLLTLSGPASLTTDEDSAVDFSSNPFLVNDTFDTGNEYIAYINTYHGDIAINSTVAAFYGITFNIYSPTEVEIRGALDGIKRFFADGLDYSFVPTANYSGEGMIEVYLDGSDGQSTYWSTTIDISPVPDEPTLVWATDTIRIPAGGTRYLPLALERSADVDGSETHFMVIQNYPLGLTFSVGFEESPGIWIVPLADVSSLQISMAPDYPSGSFFLVITTRTNDSGIVNDFDPIPDSSTPTGRAPFVLNINVTKLILDGPTTITIDEDSPIDFTSTPYIFDDVLDSGGGVSTMGFGDSIYFFSMSAVNGTISVDENLAITYGITVSVFDPSVVIMSGFIADLHAFLELGYSYSFQPTSNFSGIASLTVNGYDGFGITRSLRTNIIINPIPDEPYFLVDTNYYSALAGSSFVVDITLGQSIDVDGSEIHWIVISGLSPGMTFSAGTEISPGTWQIPFDQIPGLMITIPPTQPAGPVPLIVTPFTNDSGVIRSWTDLASEITIDVRPNSFAPSITLSTSDPLIENGYVAIAVQLSDVFDDGLPYQLSISATQGSFAIDLSNLSIYRITLDSDPATGTLGLTGRLIDLQQFFFDNTLLFYASPAYYSGLADVVGTLQSPGTAFGDNDLPLTILPDASVPTFITTPATGIRNTALPLTLSLDGLVDQDGSETTTVTISAPIGTVDYFTDQFGNPVGRLIAPDTWEFSTSIPDEWAAFLAGLNLVPVSGYFGQFNLSLHAHVTDRVTTDGGDYLSESDTDDSLSVTIAAPPTVVVDPLFTILEGSSATITFTIDDPDALPNDPYAIQLITPNGIWTGFDPVALSSLGLGFMQPTPNSVIVSGAYDTLRSAFTRAILTVPGSTYFSGLYPNNRIIVTSLNDGLISAGRTDVRVLPVAQPLSLSGPPEMLIMGLPFGFPTVSAGTPAPDPDEVTTVYVINLPAGSSLSAGSLVTSGARAGQWAMSLANLSGLRFTPPNTTPADYLLTFEAETVDPDPLDPANPSIAITSHDVLMMVRERLQLSFTPKSMPEGSTALFGPLVRLNDPNATPGDQNQLILKAYDGTFTITTPIPSGLNVTLDGSSTLLTITGDLSLMQDWLAAGGPTIIPASPTYSGITAVIGQFYNLKFSSISTLSHSESSIYIMVMPLASPLVPTVSTADTSEEQAVPLRITIPPTPDTDGSETVQAIIRGLPSGARLNRGTETSPGTWTVDAVDIPGLILTPPSLFTGTFDLQVSAVVVDRVDRTRHPAFPAPGIDRWESPPVTLRVIVSGTPITMVVTGGSVEENSILETVVARLNITGGHPGETFTTEFVSSTGYNFTVDSNGTIRVGTQNPEYESLSSFDMTVRIRGSRGTIVTRVVPITILNVNEPPTVAGGTFSTQEDAPAPLIDLRIADPDAFNSTIQVQFHVNHGSITVANFPGVTLTGNGSGTVVLQGTLTALNELFRTSTNVMYLGDQDYSGLEVFIITVNDLGESGIGFANEVIEGRAYEIMPVVDNPRITFVTHPIPGDEDTPVALGMSIATTDRDGSESIVDPIRITGLPSGASFTVGTSLGNGGWSMTLAELATAKFVPPANASGTYHLILETTILDHPSGSELSATQVIPSHFDISIRGVADRPTTTVRDLVMNEGDTIAPGFTVVTDDRDGSETITVFIPRSDASIDFRGGVFDAARNGWLFTPAQFASMTIVTTQDTNQLAIPYTIVTTVKEADGDQLVTQSTFRIEVKNVAPSLTPFRIASGPSDDGTVTITMGSLVDPGLESVWSMVLNWGDGIIDRSQPIPGSLTALTHQFTSPGIYPVQVTLFDDDDSWTQTIQVRYQVTPTVPPTMTPTVVPLTPPTVTPTDAPVSPPAVAASPVVSIDPVSSITASTTTTTDSVNPTTTESAVRSGSPTTTSTSSAVSDSVTSSTSSRSSPVVPNTDGSGEIIGPLGASAGQAAGVNGAGYEAYVALAVPTAAVSLQNNDNPLLGQSARPGLLATPPNGNSLPTPSVASLATAHADQPLLSNVLLPFDPTSPQSGFSESYGDNLELFDRLAQQLGVIPVVSSVAIVVDEPPAKAAPLAVIPETPPAPTSKNSPSAKKEEKDDATNWPAVGAVAVVLSIAAISPLPVRTRLWRMIQALRRWILR